MIKGIAVMVMCLFVFGCASMDVEPRNKVLSKPKDAVFVPKEKIYTNDEKVLVIEKTGQSEVTNFDKVYLGMTLQKVTSIMGDEIVVGYQKNDVTGVLEKIKMNLLYKQETLRAGSKAYLVKYYFTEINNADGIISDDELTPLVFEDNRLVGSSWDFLYRLKKELNF